MGNDVEMGRIKLKPCPFCGGEAECYTNYYNQYQWTVQCDKCLCRTLFYYNREDAKRAWNRRVNDTNVGRMEDDGR